VSFAATTLCVASQGVIANVSVYFVIDSVRKLLDIPSFIVSNLIMRGASPLLSFYTFMV